MLFGKSIDTCMRTRKVLNGLTYIDVLEYCVVGQSKVVEEIEIGSGTSESGPEKEAENPGRISQISFT